MRRVTSPRKNAPNGKRINLHAFWDDLPGIDPSYASVTRVADEIGANEKLKVANLSQYYQNKTIHSLVRESYDYVVNFAYDRKHVRYAHIDDLDSGKLAASEIPQLEQPYVDEVTNHRLAANGPCCVTDLRRTEGGLVITRRKLYPAQHRVLRQPMFETHRRLCRHGFLPLPARRRTE
jgi:hypothetical protein